MEEECWAPRVPQGAPTELSPKHPVDIAASLHAPVLGLYGAKDKGIPLDTVEKMRAELKKGEIRVYDDADHGFHADYRPTYHKASAEDGFRRLQAWFKTNGAA